MEGLLANGVIGVMWEIRGDFNDRGPSAGRC